MDEIELVQKIGDQVCEDYDPFADCGIDPIECDRIINAVETLKKYIKNIAG